MRLVVPLLALALADGSAATQTVRIDVVASDARGRAIDTLTAADFDVRDDGIPQTLDAARFVRTSSDDERLIAIFLDEYHVSAGATARVKEAMARLLAEQIGPRDLVVVMKPLDSVFGIRLTPKGDEARAAIDSFEGRRGEYDARNAYERNFMAGVPARIEAARTQVAISAMNALAIHFSSYADRRKTLIVVSEGIGNVERRRGLEYLATLDTVARSAQRSNVSIYVVNPGDATGGGNGLSTLADDTAGRVMAGDVDAGLRRALADASGYYLLTFRASRPDDGRFHAVQVRLKKPAGTQLLARSGYYAPAPDEALRKALLARATEPKIVPPAEPAPRSSPLIKPWFGLSRGADGRTRVTFVWEPAANPSGDRRRRTAARITLTAIAPDNSILFEGPLAPTGPAVLSEPDAPAARAVFEMPPGRLRTRITILDAAQTVLDTDVRSISVRDMAAGVTIATPTVLRARNAREYRTLDGDTAVPVSSREFSRTERLRVRFSAYGPPGAAIEVSARLLSRMGPMRALAVAAAAGAPGQSEIDVPLAGLAAGEYLIEISARGAAGEAKDVVDFRVTT
jgi:VWFA-related protein